ncbi:MAG: hypothetical protein AABZ60_13625 [Planctomycetota bacterium]
MYRNPCQYIFWGAFAILFLDRSYAYLDPGTGSYLFQVLLATFLGGIYALKLFWRQCGFALKRLFRKSEQKPLDPSKTSPSKTDAN